MQYNNEELNALCLRILSSDEIYYTSTIEYITDLYNTGCRPSELLTITAWSMQGTLYLLQMPKTGEIRRFASDELSETLKYAILQQIKPYNGLSYSQAEYEVKRSMKGNLIMSGNKAVLLYIFRYNRIRQYFEAGKTHNQVKQIFGWRSDTMAERYRTASITDFEYIPQTN